MDHHTKGQGDLLRTRKSSCVNAGGILPSTLQALTLLLYLLMGEGVPPIRSQWGSNPIQSPGVSPIRKGISPSLGPNSEGWMMGYNSIGKDEYNPIGKDVGNPPPMLDRDIPTIVEKVKTLPSVILRGKDVI